MPYGHLSVRAPPKLDLFGDRSYPTFNRFTALNQKIVKRAVHNQRQHRFEIVPQDYI